MNYPFSSYPAKLQHFDDAVVQELAQYENGEESLYYNYNIEVLKLIMYNPNIFKSFYNKLKEYNVLATSILSYYNYTNNRITYFNNIHIRSTSALRTVLQYFKYSKDCKYYHDAAYYIKLGIVEYYNCCCIKKLIFQQEIEKGKWKPDTLKKRILETRTVSIGRYANTFNIDEKNFLYAFEEQKVCFTNDPLKITKIYENGPSSCMKTTSEASNKWNKLYYDAKEKEAFHPTMFYGLSKCFKLAYSEKAGKITARSIILPETKEYLGIYAATPKEKESMHSLLEETGYTKYTQTKKFKSPEKIEIKGIWSSVINDYVLPSPYIDVIVFNYNIKFDIPKKTFVLTKYKKVSSGREQGFNTNFSSTRGYIPAKECIISIECGVCGNKIKNTNIILFENMHICGLGCASTIGLKQAFNAYSQLVYCENPAITDLHTLNNFTTENAALKMNISLMNLYLFPYDTAVLIYDIQSIYDLINYKKLTNEHLLYMWPQEDYLRLLEYNKLLVCVPIHVIEFLNRLEQKYNIEIIYKPTEYNNKYKDFCENYSKKIRPIKALNLPDFSKLPSEDVPEINW